MIKLAREGKQCVRQLVYSDGELVYSSIEDMFRYHRSEGQQQDLQLRRDQT